MSIKYVQSGTLYLAGSGTIVGATSITLTTLTDIYGNVLTMSDFGSIGYITLEPDTNNEEAASFTGVTANANGTYTLTGVKTILGKSPYTETSGLVRQHSGGTKVVITDNVGFWNTFANKSNNETITGIWSAPTGGTGSQIATNTDITNAVTGASGTATNSVFGTVKLSVAAASVPNPIVVGDNDGRVPTQSENDALVGTSGTPSSTNKYVTNDDTTGTGAIQRASALGNYALGKTTFTAGAAITAGQALHLSPYIQTDGGITFDANSAGNYASVTNQTQTHVVGSGSNRYLLVGVVSSGVPSSVTYNSVAMTLVDSQAMPAGGFTLYVYRLANPSSGSNNISVTATGIVGITGTSFSNVSQTAPEASAKTNGSSTALTLNITTLSQGALVYGVFGGTGTAGSLSNDNITHTSKYNATNSVINKQSTYSAGNSICMITGHTGKINETITTSGVTAASYSGGGSPQSSFIQVSLAPATAVSVGVVPTNSSSITFNEPLTDFIGFADSSVSVGASITTTIGGITTGLSGLTAGKTYYLSNTPGAISTTVGTYAKAVGYALTTTTLQTLPRKTVTGTGISKSNSYTYTAESDGLLGTATSTYPVTRGATYSFSAGTNFFYPVN